VSNNYYVHILGIPLCSVGYFVDPTIIQVTDPKNKLMEEEIFGPILTCYVYPDDQTDEVLELIA